MKTIACFGGGSGKSGEPIYDAMVEVGRLLAQKGYIVATGGFGGAGMEAPARGAKEAGGITIGYTFLGKPGNPYLSKTVDCEKHYSSHFGLPFQDKISPEVQYGIRQGSLLTASGFIFAAGGGPGTMVELMAAVNLNYKFWKPEPKRIAILKLVGMEIIGWDSDMLGQLSKWGVLPNEVREHILIVDSPEKAVSWVIE